MNSQNIDSQFVMIKTITLKNNLTLQYRDTGDTHAPVLIFIHGNCSSQEAWDEVIQSPLLKSYRIIAPDLPGYGLSSHITPLTNYSYTFLNYGETIAELIHYLQLKNSIFIGHSLGANILLQSAGTFSGTKGMVLINTSPIQSVVQINDAYTITKEAAVLFNESISEEELTAFAHTVLAKETQKNSDKIKQWMGMTDKYARTSIAADIPNLKNEWEIIHTLPFPVAFVASKSDTFVNQDFLQHVFPKENLWKNKIHYINEGGHYLPIEAPERLVELISEYASQQI